MDVEDVAALALALPRVTEGTSYGNRAWYAGSKRHFAWERPFSKADVKRFGGDPVPAGPILAVRLADLGEKEAVLAAHPQAYFTIPHFDGFAAVLIRLDTATRNDVAETLEDGWLACAPADLAEAYLADRGR